MADKGKDNPQRTEKGVGIGDNMKGKWQNQRTTRMENPNRLGLEKEEEAVKTGPLRDKFQTNVTKANKLPAAETLRARGKATTGRIKEADSTGLSLDDLSDDLSVRTVPEENTYQLGPTKPFPVRAVTNILMEVLSSSLKDERYNVHKAQERSLSLSSVIAERVKALRIPRYKIVVQVMIGQVKGQGTLALSRCLWDATNDTLTSYTFRNTSLFSQASVFAVYFD